MTGDRLRELVAQMSETQVWDEADPPSHVGPTTGATVAWMESRRLTPEAFLLLADAIDALRWFGTEDQPGVPYVKPEDCDALLARFRQLGDTA